MPNRKTQIYCKEYDENLSKRQPWYTIKVLSEDLSSKGVEVEIINNREDLDDSDNVNIILLFSLGYLFFNGPKIHNAKKFFLMSMPLYNADDILKLRLKTIKNHIKELYRIMLAGFIPSLLILKYLYSDFNYIATSNIMLDKLKQNNLKAYKYFPINTIIKEIGTSQLTSPKKSGKVTYGYVGPPYFSRCVDLSLEYIQQNLKDGDNAVMLIRNENPSTSNLVERIFNSVHENIEVSIDFLAREEFYSKLNDIDVLILPFEIVMSEFPVVVFEAIAKGKIVLSTKQAGFSEEFETFDNFHLISNLKDISSWPKVKNTTSNATEKEDLQFIIDKLIRQNDISLSTLFLS